MSFQIEQLELNLDTDDSVALCFPSTLAGKLTNIWEAALHSSPASYDRFSPHLL